MFPASRAGARSVPPPGAAARARRAGSAGCRPPDTIIAAESESAAGGAAREEILTLSPPLRGCHVLGADGDFHPSLSPSESGAAPRLPLPLGLWELAGWI